MLTAIPEGLLRLPNLAHVSLADNAIERLDARDCIGADAEGGNDSKIVDDAVMVRTVLTRYFLFF